MPDAFDDIYASLRAMMPAAPASTPKPKRGGKFGPQDPSRRRYQLIEPRPSAATAAAAGPCEGCRYRERCASGLAYRTAKACSRRILAGAIGFEWRRTPGGRRAGERSHVRDSPQSPVGW